MVKESNSSNHEKNIYLAPFYIFLPNYTYSYFFPPNCLQIGKHGVFDVLILEVFKMHFKLSTFISRKSTIPNLVSSPFSTLVFVNLRLAVLIKFFLSMRLCPGTTTQDESIKSDIRLELDRCLRHTQH